MEDPALVPARRRTGRGLLSFTAIGLGAALLIVALVHYGTGMVAQQRASVANLPIRGPSRAKEGALIARLQIPSIQLDDGVFEGVSDAVLEKGPGHLPETAPPGPPTRYNNIVIAGHRDSFFRRLGQVRKGEEILVSVKNRTDRYRVVGRRIVGPDDVQVAGPTAEPRLTLVTCYPFSWVGNAPYRLIVEAARIEAPAGTR